MSVEQFGVMPDGTPVECATISGGGLTAKVLSYGTVIQDLRLEGHDKPLVRGFEKFEDYLSYGSHFGATAGRVGNRIRDGHLELDGKTYQLDTNFLGKHTLHVAKRVWVFRSGPLTRSRTMRCICPLPCLTGKWAFPAI